MGAISQTLQKRAEFLALRKAPTFSCRYFLMAGAARQFPGSEAPDTPTIRFGYTVTKKLGNAVVRNRIKRRLRAAVRTGDWIAPPVPFDFVLIARRASRDGPFDELQAAIARGVATLSSHKPAERKHKAQRRRKTDSR